MKVLLLLGNAPDYREEFLRRFGEHCDLTVVGTRSELKGLASPSQRQFYNFVEVSEKGLGGIRWRSGIIEMVRNECWDVIISAFGFRDLTRCASFLLCGASNRRKWIWRGHIFGRLQFPFRDFFVKQFMISARAVLVYSPSVASRLKLLNIPNVSSFYNSMYTTGQIKSCASLREERLRINSLDRKKRPNALNGLYVGRNDARKDLWKIRNILEGGDNVNLRLVGPGLEEVAASLKVSYGSSRIKSFSKTVGKDLFVHASWADFMFCTGDSGLITLTSAFLGLPILLDKQGDHGPEVWAAKRTGQKFINFADPAEIRKFFADIAVDELDALGQKLCSYANEKFVVEHMVSVHISISERLFEGNRSGS